MMKHRSLETVREREREREPQFSKIGLFCVAKIVNIEIGEMN